MQSMSLLIKKQLKRIVKRLVIFSIDMLIFPDHGHRLTGDFKTDIQLIFFESMMGFCFWSLPGQPKWGIELQNGEKVDGWYGVCTSFKRAYDEEIPVTNADFFAEIKEDDV